MSGGGCVGACMSGGGCVGGMYEWWRVCGGHV